jgi:Tol biopolymer transport system component
LGAWRAPVQGGKPTRLTDNLSSWRMHLSPDGRSIAYPRFTLTGANQEQFELATSSAESGEPTITLPWPQASDLSGMEWAPDGKAMSLSRTIGGVGNIWLLPLDKSPPRQITKFDDLQVWCHAWSRNGGTLYVVRGRNLSEAVLIRNFR